MSINYNTLPTEKPAMGNLIPTGHYAATIVKAEMKQGKDETKPPYLNMEMDIVDPSSGSGMGKLWAILTESDAPLPRYQLSRLITALGLPIKGEFELKDLTKMIVNKKLMVDITPEETKDGKEPQRSIVDVKSAQIFYPYEVPFAEEDTPFTADAATMPVKAPAGQPRPMSQY
jgi:hypothetical protein